MSQLSTVNTIKHRIVTKGPSIHEKLRTPYALRIHVKAQIEEMLENGIIRESSSPYAAAIVMTKKMIDTRTNLNRKEQRIIKMKNFTK